VSSIREQILARMAVALTGTTSAGANVFRSREVSITRAVTPAIVIMPEAEQDNILGTEVDEHRFDLNIEIFTRGDPWDNLADPVAVQAHQILMTDAPLAALIARIRKQQSTWLGEEADRTAGVLSMRYQIHYLTKASDIGAAP
jgi:hypothetical protein